MIIAILGAEGNIGSSFVEILEKEISNVQLIKVSRNNSIQGISFKKFLEFRNYIDIVIDCALLNYEDSILLRNFLSKKNYGKFFHISTISIVHDIKSEYALNKSNTYQLFKNMDNTEIFFGDLFLYKGKYLGYWSYLKPKSFYVSYREINVFLIEVILKNIINDSTIETVRINPIKIPKYLILIFLKLKLNRLFSFFRINLIK